MWQDKLRPLAQLDASGRIQSLFIYGDKPNVPEAMVQDGVSYRILTDHLGSVRAVTDLSGNIVQRIDYDAWGHITNDTNPGVQPFGYAGGLYDPDTQLTRFGARDYDAEIGRWTAKDPIGFRGGLTSLYSYVGGDPISRTDPSGLLFGGFINAGECFGDSAAQYWADKSIHSSGLESYGYDAMGLLASLWTPSTSDATLGALAAGYGAAGLAGSAANFAEALANPILYEFGQKTLTDTAFSAFAGMSAAERGAAIINGGLGNAIFNLWGNWAKTWGTGPTPAASLFLLGGGAAEAFTGGSANQCGCK